MNKFIVITSVNTASPDIKALSSLFSWKVIIIGDKKSQAMQDTESLTYYSLEKQSLAGFSLSSKLPFNHYSRKNLGYLLAMQQHASLIYDTDDDNKPLDHFVWPEFSCSTRLKSNAKFLNVYQHFTDNPVWPRGFPIDQLTGSKTDRNSVDHHPAEIGVWQGLVSGEPDVDAIYRLTNNLPVVFENRPPVYLHQDNYCPFNSQNTLWSRRLFPLMYLPVSVTSRFSDILRSFIAQRLMHEQHLHLGFISPNVVQKRNPHHLLKDFKDEYEMYLHTSEIIKLLDEIPAGSDLISGLQRVYLTLSRHGFVAAEENIAVDAWCEDCNRLY